MKWWFCLVNVEFHIVNHVHQEFFPPTNSFQNGRVVKHLNSHGEKKVDNIGQGDTGWSWYCETLGWSNFSKANLGLTYDWLKIFEVRLGYYSKEFI